MTNLAPAAFVLAVFHAVTVIIFLIQLAPANQTRDPPFTMNIKRLGVVAVAFLLVVRVGRAMAWYTLRFRDGRQNHVQMVKVLSGCERNRFDSGRQLRFMIGKVATDTAPVFQVIEFSRRLVVTRVAQNVILSVWQPFTTHNAPMPVFFRKCASRDLPDMRLPVHAQCAPH